MNELSHEQTRRSLLPGVKERLSITERRAVDMHLAECDECRRYASESDALNQSLRRAMHARWDPHPLRASFLPFVLAKIRRQAMLRNHFQLAGALILGALLIAIAAGALSTLRPQPAAQPADTSLLSKTQSVPLLEPTSRTVGTEPAPTASPVIPQTEVLTYTVRLGDSIFAIAEKYNLTPETILWSNLEALGDNPHMLKPGMVINILPVNGVYHRWRVEDTLDGVAELYGVTLDAILKWPGNKLDAFNPIIAPGTMIVIPGGRREFVEWTAWPTGILITTGTPSAP